MSLLKLSAVIAVASALAWPLCAWAASVSSEDFVKNAAIGGMFEIQSSQMALDKSQNSDVKAFAQQMVADHTKISDDLKTALPQSSVSTMTLPTGLDAKHQAMLDDLQKATGPEFDRAYVQDQKEGHDEAVDLFKNYGKSRNDPSLQNFATQALPTLQMHRQDVKKLQSIMDKTH